MLYKGLGKQHIINLREILHPPGREGELFTDKQRFGFRYHDWMRQNVMNFPVESSTGEKKSFGPFIRSSNNKKTRIYVFSVTRKRSQTQILALLNYIKYIFPALNSLQLFVLRKKWNKITNVFTSGDLHEFIIRELKTKQKTTIKIKY